MPPENRPLFCLIDASSFIFRAYYAVRPLSNKAGLPTNAVFGFANMILKVLEEFRPSHIAVVYDTKHPSFRKEMYPEYKANRSAMPDDLVPQIPYIKKFVTALGLPAFEQPGFEADDIIATFAENAAHLSKEEAEVCIISSDKDLMQLVNDHVYLYDTMKEQRFGREQVKEKLGVFPELVADYLGIVGDSSDNIPGVKGIGPKGAVSLLDAYGSVEGIYANIDSIKKEGEKKKLIESRDNAILSKQLATVKRDLELDTDWHSLQCKPEAGESLITLLQELEFKALETRMRSWQMPTGGVAVKSPPVHEPGVPHTLAQPAASSADDKVLAKKKSYRGLLTLAELEKVFAENKSAPEVAFDTETTSLAFHDGGIVGFSFCCDGANSYYVPLNHVNADGTRLREQCEPKAALALFEKFLHGKRLRGQNVKFDLNVLRAAGVSVDAKQIASDSMIASYIINPEERHNLDYLADKYLGHKNISYASLCGEGKNAITFAQVPLESAVDYAAEDAHVAYLLADELKITGAMEKVYREIDLPLVPVLADLEWEGVCVDIPHLRGLSEEFAAELDLLVKRAHELAGQEFNLASPKQLGKILFDDLKLPVIKKTKTGYSTDVEVLEKLSHQHELPAVILNHRELAKLKSTYVDVLPELVHPKTGRVHASFNQTVAATGRLSSSDPNLQNIPIRTATGRRVRQAFVACDGNLLLGADYSQVELRILASMSGDKTLIAAFQEGQDIHALTAAQIFSVPLKSVDSDMRRKAKAINFGILYGKSAFSLAEELGIPRAEASDIIKKYFERYPTIRSFLDGLVISAKEKGYAETIFGRRRTLENINAKNKMIMAMAERMAVNTPIQGTAADLIKIAMIHLHERLSKSDLRAKLILQVHDELVLEVHKADVDATTVLVRECMEHAGAGKIHVPLTVDIGAGKNWMDL